MPECAGSAVSVPEGVIIASVPNSLRSAVAPAKLVVPKAFRTRGTSGLPQNGEGEEKMVLIPISLPQTTLD